MEKNLVSNFAVLLFTLVTLFSLSFAVPSEGEPVEPVAASSSMVQAEPGEIPENKQEALRLLAEFLRPQSASAPAPAPEAALSLSTHATNPHVLVTGPQHDHVLRIFRATQNQFEMSCGAATPPRAAATSRANPED